MLLFGHNNRKELINFDMFLEKVRIKNFKAIENLELNFQKGFNIILGDNGFGKSSILKAIVVGLNSFLTGIRGIKTSGILPDDIRIDRTTYDSSQEEWSYCLPTEITCSVTENNTSLEWSRTRKDESGKAKTIDNNSYIKKHLTNALNSFGSVLPLLSYQSDSRVWAARRSRTADIVKMPKFDRRVGYIGCLESSTDVKTIDAWCLQMEISSFQFQKKIPEYEMFKQIVSRFMQEICGLKIPPRLIRDVRKKTLVYSEDNVKYEDIHNLSAGYQSLLWMVIDIAYRLAHLNPNIDDYQNISGIVLIDEIDMHLHPNWQWKIVDALTQTFPQIQFIVTTHSPIVISSCKDANIIQLDSKQIPYYLTNAYGYSVNDVLALRLGSSEIPPTLEQLNNEFEAALLQNNITDAWLIYKDMVNLFGKDNKEVKRALLELDDC